MILRHFKCDRSVIPPVSSFKNLNFARSLDVSKSLNGIVTGIPLVSISLGIFSVDISL